MHNRVIQLYKKVNFYLAVLIMSYSMEILKDIPIQLDPDEIRQTLHIGSSRDGGHINALIETAQQLIRARAVYRVSFIQERLNDAVVLEGIRLTSRVLRKNLDTVERVFPYVVTVGDQLETMVRSCKDPLQQYYLDIIGNVALEKARDYLEDRLRSRYALNGISSMSPGSLKDWGIEEQRNLFSILGDVQNSIDVRLNKNLFMIPAKSLSGIYFPTEIRFYSCQLCPRKRCPSRKAGYDENQAREYGILK